VLPQITPEQAALDSAFTDENNDADGFVMNATATASSAMAISISPSVSFNNYDGTVTADFAGQVQQASPLMFVSASESLFAVRYTGDHSVTVFTEPGWDMILVPFSISLVVRKNGVIDSTTLLYSNQIENTGDTITIPFSFDVAPLINLSFSDVVDARLRLDLGGSIVVPPGVTSIIKYVTVQITSTDTTLNI
jgi:hypothetical protein